MPEESVGNAKVVSRYVSVFFQFVENYFWFLALVQLRQIYICWKHCGLSAVGI